jgi:hypothetical protein
MCRAKSWLDRPERSTNDRISAAICVTARLRLPLVAHSYNRLQQPARPVGPGKTDCFAHVVGDLAPGSATIAAARRRQSGSVPLSMAARMPSNGQVSTGSSGEASTLRKPLTAAGGHASVTIPVATARQTSTTASQSVHRRSKPLSRESCPTLGRSAGWGSTSWRASCVATPATPRGLWSGVVVVDVAEHLSGVSNAGAVS